MAPPAAVSERARATTRALALATALCSPSAVALPESEVARILGGLDPAPVFASHARAVGDRWEDYERRIGRPMREWAGAELPAAPGAIVFYPFSGPDFPTVAQLYPDAARFVLVAAQAARPPPALDGGSASGLTLVGAL